MEDEHMQTTYKPISAVLNRDRFKGWLVCSTALLFFAAGSFITTYLTHVKQVRADSNHVFELMIYHTIPGKAEALEAIFRDDSKLMAQHGVVVLGFWVPNEKPEWKDTFIYVVDFPSREEAKKRWAELHADPATRPYVEAAKLILQRVNDEFRVDEVYMRPSDFSAMK
jgi:hypothetical protein